MENALLWQRLNFLSNPVGLVRHYTCISELKCEISLLRLHSEPAFVPDAHAFGNQLMDLHTCRHRQDASRPKLRFNPPTLSSQFPWRTAKALFTPNPSSVTKLSLSLNSADTACV